MIELYDSYSQESRDLHESLGATGLSQLGVVIDADGFLPDGLLSPFTYYLGYEDGKPLYFNASELVLLQRLIAQIASRL